MLSTNPVLHGPCMGLCSQAWASSLDSTLMLIPAKSCRQGCLKSRSHSRFKHFTPGCVLLFRGSTLLILDIPALPFKTKQEPALTCERQQQQEIRPEFCKGCTWCILCLGSCKLPFIILSEERIRKNIGVISHKLSCCNTRANFLS